jgi:hypothetical protein
MVDLAGTGLLHYGLYQVTSRTRPLTVIGSIQDYRSDSFSEILIRHKASNDTSRINFNFAKIQKSQGVHFR